MNSQTPLTYQNLILTNQVAFVQRVRQMCVSLAIDPNWLMVLMYGESGYTFSPSIRSGGSPTGAVGLIQFTGTTAKELGTTKDLLAKMTNVRQLDYVESYFWKKGIKGKVHSLGDLYMVIFAPAYLGRADTTKVYAIPTDAYRLNASLDKAKKGYITVADIKARANVWLPKKKAGLAIPLPKQHPLTYDSIASDLPLSEEQRLLHLLR